ncbi:MAG: hypothetical protein U1E34_02805 [Amaricoccus sp.]
MKSERSLTWGAALLALPLVVAACAKPAPPPPAAPILSPGEQACVEHASQAAGVDPATVAITPTTSTKTGGTVYSVTSGAHSFMCVVEADQKVSIFKPQK